MLFEYYKYYNIIKYILILFEGISANTYKKLCYKNQFTSKEAFILTVISK